MSFQKLNNDALLAAVKNLVREESRLTQEILDYLAEVQIRRLYALRGYSSLFEFCVRELGYSESAAHRRISAMRVIQKLPEAKEKLAEGSVNLSTLTQLHGFMRRDAGAVAGKIAAVEILAKIENKSQRECERELVKISPAAALPKDSTRAVGENQNLVKFVASDELMEKLERVRDLLAHKKLDSLADVVDAIADLALEKLERRMKSTSAAEVRIDTSHSDKKDSSVRKTSGLTAKKPPSGEKKSTAITKVYRPYLSVHLRARIWQRDRNVCQYRDPLTGRRCECRRGLQIDHIIPLAKGGKTDEENLRLLCQVHNQTEAIREFSVVHMQRFVKSLQREN